MFRHTVTTALDLLFAPPDGRCRSCLPDDVRREVQDMALARRFEDLATRDRRR